MSLAGIVLAAGRSERMGAPKALLDYRVEALLWSAFLQALAALHNEAAPGRSIRPMSACPRSSASSKRFAARTLPPSYRHSASGGATGHMGRIAVSEARDQRR